MVQTLPFEDNARDLVNFGIAFFNQFSDALADVQRKAADGYQDLVNRGAQDKSDVAEGLRKFLTEGLGLLGLSVTRPAANRPVPAPAAAVQPEIILPKKKTRKKAG